MIAHVAEASEAKGRVVVELKSARPHPLALDAACLVAQAFQSEIETLFVEDEGLIALAAYPFASEITASGRSRRPLLSADLKDRSRALSHALHAEVEKRARKARVPIRARTVVDGQLDALTAVCAEYGPWNVVALADAISGVCGPRLSHMLDAVSGATGLVLVGPHARRTSGPVVLAVESADRLPAMLRAGERLAAQTGGDLTILLIGRDDDDVLWLEAEARLALEARPNVKVGTLARHLGSSAIVAEALRLSGAGFIIAQVGGLAVPCENSGQSSLSALLSGLECPLFLVR